MAGWMSVAPQLKYSSDICMRKKQTRETLIRMDGMRIGCLGELHFLRLFQPDWQEEDVKDGAGNSTVSFLLE
jgi:hypothetical protein